MTDLTSYKFSKIELSISQKGKPLLRYKGHGYMHKRTNQDGSTVWLCNVGKQNRCFVTLKSKDNQVIHESGRHTHKTDLVRDEARKVMRSLKDSVVRQPGVATRQVISRAIADVLEEVLAAMPTILHFGQFWNGQFWSGRFWRGRFCTATVFAASPRCQPGR